MRLHFGSTCNCEVDLHRVSVGLFRVGVDALANTQTELAFSSSSFIFVSWSTSLSTYHPTVILQITDILCDVWNGKCNFA